MLNLSPSSKKILGIMALVLLFGTAFGIDSLINIGSNVGYSPVQPLPFSHKMHAGVNKIPCLYCHSGADKSRHATVPSTNVCMNCHRAVKVDSPYIKQLKEGYDKGDPLAWIRVHDQPDFVNFNHKRHVKNRFDKNGVEKKGFECKECHGDVATMDKITQVKTLNMGFCVQCHRKNEGPTDCWACHK